MTRIINESVHEEASASEQKSTFTVIVESQESNKYTTQDSALPRTKNLDIEGTEYRATQHEDGSITCEGDHPFSPELKTAIRGHFPYFQEGEQLKSTKAGNYYKIKLPSGTSVISTCDVGDQSTIGIQMARAAVDT